MLRKNIFRFTLAFSVVLLAVCSSSCFYCIGGSNVVRTENRTSQVTTFNEIELRGDFDINFEQDTIDNYEVLVEGDDNIIPYISTIVQGNRLIIEYNTSKCFNHSNDIDINIKARDLSKLIISGSGNAYSNKLITNTLDLQISGSGNINFRNDTLQTLSTNISGSGNITLNGTTKSSELNISGSGSFGGFELLQGTCNATISGSGSMEISFTDQLNANISGSGCIYYNGDPNHLKTNINGSGRVVHYQNSKK